MRVKKVYVVWSFALVVTLLTQPVWGAGSSSAPVTSPDDQAAEAYNRGLKHRDKAWSLEEQAASASSDNERSKLEAKIRKEYEKAIRGFRSAIEVSPQMHQAHGSLGYALRKTGQLEESLAAYNRALEIRPDYAEAIEYRAETYLGLDRLEEVQEAYLNLFRNDRERADELMSAMKRWVEERSADPGSLGPSAVEEFSAWVEERSEIAGQTASLYQSSDRTW